MQCPEFSDRLNDLLDRRLRPEADAELAKHAAQCAGCRDLLAATQALFAGLRARQVKPLAADFAKRVVGQVALGPAPPAAIPSRRWAWVAVAAIATAAAVVLSVSPAWGPRPAGTQIAQGDPADLPPGSPALYEAQLLQWVNTLPEAVERFEEVDYKLVEEYTPGLRSLRASLAIALDTLRRSLPGHRDMPKSEGVYRSNRDLNHV